MIDTSIVDIVSVVLTTKAQAGLLKGKNEPYAYTFGVAFRSDQPVTQPAFVTVNPAEAFTIMKKLGTRDHVDLPGKSFDTKQEWYAHDSGKAFRSYIADIVQQVYILNVVRDIPEDADGEWPAEWTEGVYKVSVSFVPQVELDRMSVTRRALFALAGTLRTMFGGRAYMSVTLLTAAEFKSLRTALWNNGTAPKDLVGVSFQVNPRWDAKTPSDAVRKLLPSHSGLSLDIIAKGIIQ